MTTLNVWIFPAVADAGEALRVLERRQTRRMLVIDDCAVVTWPLGESRPQAFQAGTVDGSAALSGAFWGLLFGSQLLAPLAGLPTPVWPPDGLARIGFPEALLRVIRARTRPGTSALFVLGPGRPALDLPCNTRAMTHRLTVEQEAALQRAFGTRAAL